MTYQGAHDRVTGLHGPARRWQCVACGIRADEWAMLPDAPAPLLDPATGCLYSTDPQDYRPMCVMCHRLLDARARRARLALEVDPAEVLPGLGSPSFVQAPASTRAPMTRYAEPVAVVAPALEPLPLPELEDL
ncbi:hypothetical protein IGS67_13485 [Flavimobilis sp. GY10621]|uniref:HNH endonuclease n=1 Tax=Flavimobilis rhizosphaerae TaxID=2775421 RepID=A0ABR9DVW8_9MICO|nr:hypothetical protein [Flavimobilis rhizosphaerae]MBD9700482.1 hypothetical protein [Flavimobilis rhizosphaerae]